MFKIRSFFPVLLFLFLVNHAMSQGAFIGKCHAVFFATDNYKDKQIKKLKNPISDAEAIAKILESDYGFTTEMYKDPTGTKILQTLRSLAQKKFGPEDQLFIYFTGHGEFDEVSRAGYLIPSDGDSKDTLGSTLVDYAELKDKINKLSSGHIILCIDACFSGSASDKIALGEKKNARPSGLRPEDSDINIRKINERKSIRSRLLLTSSGNTPSYDGVDRSPFADVIINALGKPAIYGYCIDWEEIKLTFNEALPEATLDVFGQNEPGGGSDFFFIHNNLSKGATKEVSKENKSVDNIDGLLQRVDANMVFIQPGTITNTEIDKVKILINNMEVSNLFSLKPSGSFSKWEKKEDVNGFWVSRYEVPFEQYQIFCNSANKKMPDDNGWGKGDNPVINVDWMDAVMYCNWLSKQSGMKQVYLLDLNNNVKETDLSANGYRLPTKQEWLLITKDTDKSSGNLNGSDRYPYTAPIGLSRNNLDLYDLTGNVWEWSNEGFCNGGSWFDEKAMTSVNFGKAYKSNAIGFRVCRTTK